MGWWNGRTYNWHLLILGSITQKLKDNFSDNYHKEKNTVNVVSNSASVKLTPNQFINLPIAFSGFTKVNGIADIDFSGYDSLNIVDIWIDGNIVYVQVHNCGNYDKSITVTVKAFQLK